MRGPEVSRRNFLKLLTTGKLLTAGVASSGIPLATAFAYAEGSGLMQYEPRLEGPFDISGLKLSVLVTEHAREDWRKYGDRITSILDRFNIIIPEYFPYEYLDNRNPLTKAAHDHYLIQNYVFDKVEVNARKNAKTVWIVDPAYSGSFVLLRGGLSIPEDAALYGAFVKIVTSNYATDRRTFIRYFKNFILGLSAFSCGFFIPPEILLLSSLKGLAGAYTENNLRHSVVAEAIKRLPDHLKQNSEALLIYPQAHWEGIQEYLSNDDRRDKILSRYRGLQVLPFLDEFFKARNFISNGQQWQKQPGFVI